MLIELAFLILLKRDLFGDSDGEDELVEIDSMEIDLEESQVREVKETTPEDIYFYQAEEVENPNAERIPDNPPAQEVILEVEDQSDDLIEEEEADNHLTL